MHTDVRDVALVLTHPAGPHRLLQTAQAMLACVRVRASELI